MGRGFFAVFYKKMQKILFWRIFHAGLVLQYLPHGPKGLRFPNTVSAKFRRVFWDIFYIKQEGVNL